MVFKGVQKLLLFCKERKQKKKIKGWMFSVTLFQQALHVL